MKHFPCTFSSMPHVSIMLFHVLSYFLISFTPEVLSICFYPADSFCFPNLKNWNPNFIRDLKFVQVDYSFCFLFKVESLTTKDSLRYHLSSIVSLLTCCCLFVSYFVVVFVTALTYCCCCVTCMCSCYWFSSIIVMEVC